MSKHWRHRQAADRAKEASENEALIEYRWESKDRDQLTPAQRFQAYSKGKSRRTSKLQVSDQDRQTGLGRVSRKDSQAGSSTSSSDSASSPTSSGTGYLAHLYEESLDFDLDKFQRRALTELEAGNNVLVAAPTGAGKTIIADFAIYLARQGNVKAFYTTPIKALSNQKYHDLVRIYGPDKVGLLTGDMSINSEADIVVMTTEVLRNMLYEGSTTLTALRYVILDEVHYLADRMRGQVWEEVIIHLPKDVKVVGLSATVSNVEDFANWIQSVRGKTSLIVSEKRPVPLIQEVMLQESDRKEPRLFDLYQDDQEVGKGAKVNPQLIVALDQLERKAQRQTFSHQAPGRGKNKVGAYGRKGLKGRHGNRGGGKIPTSSADAGHHTPRRWAVVDELDFLGLLPGIYFIFSRNGCDQAVSQCMQAGLSLTSREEAQEIRQIVDSMAYGQLTADDKKALRFADFRHALEEGIAPHHAGMITLYRQIVEKLFEQGLLKVVFATETLALGINMPARSVVVEKLEKFNGVSHETLSPGEFTQLTGRAGRRGIDPVGYSVIVDHPGFLPQTALALASKRVYPLHSSFAPTFNMAVNLLNRYDLQTARRTLDHSFAQWEATLSAKNLDAQIQTSRQTLEGYEKDFACDYGDFADFMRIRLALTDLERSGRRQLKHQRFANEKARKRAFADLDARIADLKKQEKEHPCRSCPDLDSHLRIGYKWGRLLKELDRLEERYNSRTGTVSRQFDRLCSILSMLDYIEDVNEMNITDEVNATSEENETSEAENRARAGHSDQPSYRLTESGQLLRRIYSEKDIVLAQVLHEGTLDSLTAEEMASVASAFVYEPRRGSSTGMPRHFPGGEKGRLAQTAYQVLRTFQEINGLCEDYGTDSLPDIDFGLSEIMFNWVTDKPLTNILRDSDLTGGDFVRNCKRTVDILTQISTVGDFLPDSRTAEVAHEAAALVNKGIVAYSGIDEE